MPSPAVVAAMEARFRGLRRIRARDCCFVGARVRDLNLYWRQYVGIVVDGRRLIYINAEPAGEGPPPEDHVLDVCDGGASWGALYDPATDRFFDLAFNGV